MGRKYGFDSSLNEFTLYKENNLQNKEILLEKMAGQLN